MTTQDIMAIGGLIIAFASLITGFILQRDAKKIRLLERDNKKYKGRLMQALNAIKSYQSVEIEHAAREGVDVATYRRKVRKETQEYFNSSFLTPSNIDEMLSDLENN